MVGLTQRNLDKLEETFWAVSDPKNPDYGMVHGANYPLYVLILRAGNHLSFESMVDLIAPSEESLENVMSWMTENGVQVSK